MGQAVIIGGHPYHRNQTAEARRRHVYCLNCDHSLCGCYISTASLLQLNHLTCSPVIYFTNSVITSTDGSNISQVRSASIAAALSDISRCLYTCSYIVVTSPIRLVHIIHEWNTDWWGSVLQLWPSAAETLFWSLVRLAAATVAWSLPLKFTASCLAASANVFPRL